MAAVLEVVPNAYIPIMRLCVCASVDFGVCMFSGCSTHSADTVTVYANNLSVYVWA